MMKIPNHKSQIPNKSQYLNDQKSKTTVAYEACLKYWNLNIWYCLEFGAWNLEFKTQRGLL